MKLTEYSWECAVAALAFLTWPTFALAFDPRWNVTFQHDLRVVEVVVDTHPLSRYVLVSEASLVVQLFDSQGALIGEQKFNFLDPVKLPVMEAGQIYERHFPLSLQTVASVKGVMLDWRGGRGGAQADTPGGRVGPSESALPRATRRISDESPDLLHSVQKVSLIQGSDPAIYIVADGRRRRLPDMTTFNLLGFNLNDVQRVDSFPATTVGPDIASISTALVKGSRPPVFLLEGGKRRWVRDSETLQSLLLKWKEVQVIPDDDLRLMPVGADVSR